MGQDSSLVAVAVWPYGRVTVLAGLDEGPLDSFGELDRQAIDARKPGGCEALTQTACGTSLVCWLIGPRGGPVSWDTAGMVNRLANSQSPYLLQHASNPVDWWPWGEEAMQEAKRRDVPILLSVGYSSCHLA